MANDCCGKMKVGSRKRSAIERMDDDSIKKAKKRNVRLESHRRLVVADHIDKQESEEQKRKEYIKQKSSRIWVVNNVDTGCDAYGYISITRLFYSKMRAQVVLESMVREEEEVLEKYADWSMDRDMAIIDSDNGRRLIFTLENKEIE